MSLFGLQDAPFFLLDFSVIVSVTKGLRLVAP